MKKLILFLLITCSWAAQAQIATYNNAARNTFYGIGGYSFHKGLFLRAYKPTHMYYRSLRLKMISVMLFQQ